MQELKMSMEKIKEAKKTLMCWFEMELAKGRSGEGCFDVEAAGQVVDMIKDFAEAEEKCWKAKYYEKMIEAFENGGDRSFEEGSILNSRFGYDNWRYPSSGRFASAGHGSYMGYSPDLMMYEERDGEMYAGPFGYSSNGNQGQGSNRGASNGRGRSGNSGGSSGGNSRMGYPMEGMNRYGRAYNEYENARRHYSETGDEASKKEMHEKIRESVGDAVESFHQMYHNANPELQREMMDDLEELLTSFKGMQAR